MEESPIFQARDPAPKSNKKLNLTKYFKDDLLDTKDNNGVQAFVYQFNLDYQRN